MATHGVYLPEKDWYRVVALMFIGAMSCTKDGNAEATRLIKTIESAINPSETKTHDDRNAIPE